MSDETKNNTPPNDDRPDTPKPEEANSDTATGSDAKPSDAKASDAETKDAPKKRGIGFLGRKGTAPIRTEPKDEKKDEKPAAPPPPPPLGIAEKIFFTVGDIPALAIFCLILILLLQSSISILLPSVFFAHELHLVEVYSDMQGMGQWFIPPATEHLQATFPAFFWFMALVDAIPLTDTIFLPMVTSISMLIALMGVYTLGLCTGLGKRISFAAGLLSLVSIAFMGLGHCVSLDFFTAGLFSFALALLYRGWVNDSAPMSFMLGFFFTALATLSSGFLPLWTILISSIILIIWRGTFGRANKLDAVMGFGVLVVTFAIWLLIIIIGGGQEATTLDQLMQQMILPFTPPFWPLKPTWYYGISLLAIGLMPWIFLPLFVSWVKIFKNIMPSLKAARKENSGPTWLYITFFVGTLLLILSGETYISITLLPVLIVLLAKSLCNLSALGSRVFYAIFAFLTFVDALICLAIYFAPTSSLWADFLPAQVVSIVQNVQGLEVISGILFICSIVLFKFTKRASPGGSLLVVTLFMLLLVQPFTMLVAPSLPDNIVKYHPLGSGMGSLPYGLGAPAPGLLPVDDMEQSPQPNIEQPATEQSAPAQPEPETEPEPNILAPTEI